MRFDVERIVENLEGPDPYSCAFQLITNLPWWICHLALGWLSAEQHTVDGANGWEESRSQASSRLSHFESLE